jgi:hypothetical protein
MRLGPVTDARSRSPNHNIQNVSGSEREQLPVHQQR